MNRPTWQGLVIGLSKFVWVLFLSVLAASGAAHTAFAKTIKQAPVSLPPATQSAPPPDAPATPLAATLLPGEVKQIPQSDPQTGALTYTYSLTTPPGRNNINPNLHLNYSSQNISTRSVFGQGWGIDIPYIERINKLGADQLYTASSTYFYSSLSGELATSTATSTYYAQSDDGAFLAYQFANNQWIATDKKGNTYIFGDATASRQDNPGATQQVYKWMLSREQDANGNFIRYEYFKDQGQIYPQDILYTGNGSVDGPMRIDFTLSLRADVATSSDPGFSVLTRYLITKVQTEVASSTVRIYDLGYSAGDNESKSLLSTITESGVDSNGATTTLPATQFQYGVASGTVTQDTNYTIPVLFTSNTTAPGVFSADVNGDGYPDLVQSYIDYQGSNQAVYINNANGTGWTASSSYSVPTLFAYYGEDRGARIVDVNGDGLPDIVQSLIDHGGSNNAVYLNKGDGTGWALSSTTLPTNFSYYGEDQGARIADVNGDGLPDIVQSFQDSFGSNNAVYLNRGDNKGWALSSTSVPIAISLYGGDFGVRLVDINGDGLTDIVQSFNGSFNGNPLSEQEVFINQGGNGWVQDMSWTIPEWFIYQNGNAGVDFADINGDGLPDLLKSCDEHHAPGHAIYLNTGSGFVQDSSYSALPAFISDYGDQGVFIDDVNGDGRADFVQSTDFGGNVTQNVYVMQPAATDLLAKITTTQGAISSTAYAATPLFKDPSTGAVLNPKLPDVLQVVSSISSEPGVGEIVPHVFSYKDGSYFFQSSTNRKFAGFGSIAISDAEGNTTTTFYHQGNGTASTTGEYNDDEAKIGKSYRVETAGASGNPLTTQINKWDDVSRGGLASFVKVIQSTLLTYGPSGAHTDKAENYAYNDTTGDQIERTEWGQVNANTDGSFTDTGTDKFIIDVTYAASSTNPISLPDQSTTVDQSGARVRQTTDYYDNLGFGSVAGGNLTKELKWIAGTSTAETDTTYNGFGLPTQVTDAGGHPTNYSYDAYSLYPATTTSALGYTNTAIYDYSAGKPTQTTNENGVTFKTIFDGLDRVLEQDEPDPLNASSSVPKVQYAYTDDTMPRRVQETDYLTAGNTAVGYTYLDGLGRAVQKLAEAEGANTYTSVVNTYDARGLLQSQSLPYFVTSSGFSALSNPPPSALLTNYTYDPLSRVLKTSTHVGSSTNAYDGWKTTTTDPNGHAKDFTNDAYGNLLQVVEHNDDGNYTTNYQYDGNNNLTHLTDANGNIRNFVYDGLSRRTSAEDLHPVGSSTPNTWTYTYDTTGNLTKQKDPKNQTTKFTYDALNRVLTETLSSVITGTTTGGRSSGISYQYDSCAYGRTQLCTASTSAAKTSYTYTPFGRVASENQVISGLPFTTSYTYDRLGNKTGITYPDGSLVSYLYNSAGALESITELPSGTTTPSTIVSNFDYAPNGKVSYALYGNGVSTTNTYDPDQLYRLTQILTVASTTPQSPGAPAAVPTLEVASSTPSLPSVSTTGATSTIDASGTTTPTISLAPTYALSDDVIEDDGLDAGTTTPPVDVASVETIEPTSPEDSTDTPESTTSTPVVATTTEATSTEQGSGSPTLPLLSNVSSTSTTTASSTAPAADPVLDLQLPTLSAIQNISYVYDPAGNITNVYDYSSTQAAHVTAFTYDYLNRLKTASTTVASTTPYSQTYTYDKVGNITSGPLGTYAYTGANNANPDAVNTIGSAILKYDKDGNLTKHDSTSYAWDYLNRLSSIMGNGATSTYAYDFQNSRVIKTTATSTSYYPNDLYSLNGTTPRRNIFATDGTLVAVVRGSASSTKTFTIHPDNLGSTNVITDASGTPTGVTDYYPFGSERVDTGTSVARKFIGEEYDDDSNLSYLNARYYEGARGQFLSQDPQFWTTQQNLQDPESLNAYSYAEGNPITNKDPSGKTIWDYFVGAANALGSDFAWGAGRVDYSNYHGNQGDYLRGQALGDTTSVLASFAEITSGTSLGGGAALATAGSAGVLAPVSVPAAVAGAAAVTHGAGVAVVSGGYLLQDLQGPIIINTEAGEHVMDNHTSGGVNSSGSSIFNPGENISDLVHGAEGNPTQLQAHGTYKTTYDVGRNVGVDRNNNFNQTSLVSTITRLVNGLHHLITSFPGK